jgi:hypothetical protein
MPVHEGYVFSEHPVEIPADAGVILLEQRGSGNVDGLHMAEETGKAR